MKTTATVPLFALLFMSKSLIVDCPHCSCIIIYLQLVCVCTNSYIFFFSSRGIYVQDLNPCNILLNENGELTLTYHCQWISIENPPNPRALNQLYVAPEVGLFLPCCLFIYLFSFVCFLILIYHKNLFFRLSLK